ncbi:MAG: ABC transporter permease [Dehalococcoidales bacterium]
MRLFLRRKDELFWTLAFPVLFILLFGAIYGNSKWEGMSIRSIDYLLPGIIVMGAMVTGIMRTATGLVQEREQGIYRRLALTPLKRTTLIGSQLLQHYAVIIVQTLLLIAIGGMAFKTHLGGNMVLFWLTLSLGALCFMSIGFALTGLIKTLRSATPIIQITYFSLMFLGGIFFPNSLLPNWLDNAAKVLPSTQMGDALRAVAYNGAGIGDIWQKLAMMVAWIAVCLVISIRFFRWE